MDYQNINAEKYRQTDLRSMSPEKMIVALYERLLRDLDEARDALAAGDVAAANRAVTHAQAIVTALRGALDHTVGGEISANLDDLYEFVFRKLLSVLADRDPAELAACRTVLEPLLDAWRQVPAGAGEREARRRVQEAAAAGANPAKPEGEAGATGEAAAPAPRANHLNITV